MFSHSSSARGNDDCRKMISHLRTMKGHDGEIDPHIIRLGVSSANRIVGSSTWTEPTYVSKLSKKSSRVSFSSKTKTIELYINDFGEVIAYVEDEKKFWCMKEK